MSLQEAVQGHWRRHWIKAPGFEDHTTRVHWTQVGAFYADVRIPIARPDLTHLRSLSEMAAGDLALLAQAEGFAGRVTLTGSQCTWHRHINWHGATDEPDVGDISFDAQGNMVETGVHADYAELWIPQEVTAPMAQCYGGAGYRAYVVSVGAQAVVGIGDPAKPATAPIISALGAGELPKETSVLFDGLHAVGRWLGQAFVPDLATNPFAETRPAVTLQDDRLIWHHIGFDGTLTDIVMRRISADK